MKLLYFVEDALENLVKTVTKVESFKNVKEKFFVGGLFYVIQKETRKFGMLPKLLVHKLLLRLILMNLNENKCEKF